MGLGVWDPTIYHENKKKVFRFTADSYTKKFYQQISCICKLFALYNGKKLMIIALEK